MLSFKYNVNHVERREEECILVKFELTQFCRNFMFVVNDIFVQSIRFETQTTTKKCLITLPRVNETRRVDGRDHLIIEESLWL